MDGIGFVDIDNNAGARNIGFSSTAPDWRMVKESGLCLEGKCMNRSCRAFGHNVIISKGMGTYDLVFDSHENECPVCSEHVKTTKCAFTDCLYSYTGVKL